jgi:hypothetical protein
MNYSTAVMIINPAIKAVMGKYEESGVPELFKTILTDLKVGDFAVVESGTRWGFTTVKITELNVDPDFDSSKTVRWVVQRVSVEQHENIKGMEDVAIELIKKGELRKRREDIVKNTLDAASAGEINNLDIARLGSNVIADGTKAV